jgi:hypothetical protein
MNCSYSVAVVVLRKDDFLNLFCHSLLPQEKLARLSEALVYYLVNTSRAILVKLGAIRSKDPPSPSS